MQSALPDTSEPSSISFNRNNSHSSQEEDTQYGRSYSKPNSYKSKGGFSSSWEGRGKGKERAWSSGNGRLHGVNTDKAGGKLGASPIQCLPIEGLAHIFARLPPQALQACALVCRDWADLIQQDSTWKAAFLYHFNLQEDLSQTPGQRLATRSWRAEFLARHDLAQKWTKSKVPTVTHDPRIGNISFVHADIALNRHAGSAGGAPTSVGRRNLQEKAIHGSPSMLSVSLQRGIASRSDPYTGKVTKGGFIEGAPAPAFAMMGIAVDTVTCASASKEGSALVWGMANGSVHLSRTGLAGRFAHGQGQRSAIPLPLGTAFHNHFGPILCMTFLEASELVATAAADGIVKIWDCSSGCIWTSQESLMTEAGRLDEGVALAFARAEGSQALLAVGSRTGIVYCWRIDMKTYSTKSFWRFKNTDFHNANVCPVQSIHLDVGASAILVNFLGVPAFYRINIDRPVISFTTFGHLEDHVGPITALNADFQVNRPEQPSFNATATISSVSGSVSAPESRPLTPLSQNKSQKVSSLGSLAYVIAGDEQGRTFMWDWNAMVASSEMPVKPIRQLQGFETKVTSIELTDLLILVGSADGTIRAYDLLCGRLVRNFNERSAPRHALRHLVAGQADEEEERRWAVNQIVASREGFVASIGARVLAWRAGDDHKARKKASRTGGRLSSRAERYRTDLELRQDIKESTNALDNEQSDRVASFRQMRKAQAVAGIPQSLGDMTEEEAIAFAMMLSQEEEESRVLRESAEDQLDDDLSHLQLEEEDPDLSYYSRPPSQGTSGYTHEHTESPSPRQTLSPPVRARQSPGPSSLNISPRLAPQTYRSSPGTSPVPDINELSAWPLPSPVLSPVSVPLLANTTQPGKASPSAGSWGATAPGKWTELAAKRTPSQLSTSPASSLLATQLQQQAQQQHRMSTPAFRVDDGDDFDAELKYVLELSRVEEESRQAALAQSKP